MTRIGKPSGIVVYLDCGLCGRAFSPHRANPGNLEEPVRCPACTRQKRNLGADTRSQSFTRERTLARKARESRDAVARRLKG